jgi:uncharacterized protein
MPFRKFHPQSENAALADVAAIYQDLEARPVERNCIRRCECCQFQITGKTPVLTKGEALYLARAWKATGRKKFPDSVQGACPVFDPAGMRCLVYEGRPFGCRTHFCVPAGGPVKRREVLDLIRRLEDVDRSLGGDGSHPLTRRMIAGTQ